jgi:hypothetical protein
MTTTPRPAALGRALRLLLAVAGFGFIVMTGRELVRDFDPSRVEVDWRFFLASVPVAVVANWVTSEAWLRLLDAWTGRSIERRAGRALYFAAQVARYTPGKVGLPAVRIAGAGSLGTTAQTMGSTFLLEVLTWCTTGGATAGLVLALFPDVFGELGRRFASLSWLAFLGALVALGVLVFVDRRLLPRGFAKLLHLSGTGPVLPLATVGLYFVHWFGWVGHGTLLGLAFGASPERAVLIGAALVLGILAGFLAFLAPAGAGVREAVIATVAAPVIGAAGAVSAGLVARAISLGLDVIYWLVSARIAKSTPRATPSS